MEQREHVAAMLLDRDERPGSNVRHFVRYVLDHKDAEHMGDCPKAKRQFPMTCDRCVVDQALADADQIIAVVASK